LFFKDHQFECHKSHWSLPSRSREISWGIYKLTRTLIVIYKKKKKEREKKKLTGFFSSFSFLLFCNSLIGKSKTTIMVPWSVGLRPVENHRE
jgi:hypothetical protein